MSNARHGIRAIAAAILLGLPGLSAQITMSLSAPVQGSIDNTPLPAGPLAFPLTFAGGGAGLTATDNFVGQATPTAFEFRAYASASASAYPAGWPPAGSWASDSSNITATLRLTLQSATPFTGALRLRSSQYYDYFQWSLSTITQSAYGSARTRIDIGADGTFEHDFVASFGSNNRDIELPVAFQSTLAIDVVIELYQSVTAGASPLFSASTYGNAAMTLSGELNDDSFVVQEHATTGATAQLGFVHAIDGNLQLTISTPSATPAMSGFFVIGLQPVVMPLLPTVTQLVTADAVVFGTQANAVLPSLPGGTTMYVQGFGLTPLVGWSSTRSLRVLWL